MASPARLIFLQSSATLVNANADYMIAGTSTCQDGLRLGISPRPVLGWFVSEDPPWLISPRGLRQIAPAP
jgi:hypothetical protein